MTFRWRPACLPLFAAGAILTAAQAVAQSTVAIGGLVDVGVYRGFEGQTQVGQIQRSNLALSGRERLGDDLHATFHLSMRFDPGTGMLENQGLSPFWHGQSTIGLEGGLGTVQFGRRLNAVSYNDGLFDPWDNFDSVASPAWDLWHYNFPSDPLGNSGFPEYGRLDNGVFYESPSVHGFTLHASGSPNRSDNAPHRALGAALVYQSGFLTGMAARSTNSAGHTDTFYGVKTTWGPVALMAAWNRSKAAPSVARALTFGATYKTGGTTLKAGWGRVDVDGSRNKKVLALGAHHALSRRTAVYADYAYKTFLGDSAHVYGIGLAHAF